MEYKLKGVNSWGYKIADIAMDVIGEDQRKHGIKGDRWSLGIGNNEGGSWGKLGLKQRCIAEVSV